MSESFDPTSSEACRLLITPMHARRGCDESDARFRALSDSTPVMVWATDAKGKMQFVNRAYAAFFGITEHEIRARDWKPLLHREDADGYASAFFAALREHKPFMAQARVRRRDGEWRWIESYGAAQLAPSGELVAFVGSSRDITERKTLDDALRSADRRKDEFLAVLAHELRNPLAPIQNAVQVLDAVGSPTPAAKQARDIIKRQVQHMSRLIGDLLDISRVASGKLECRFARCDLAAITRNIADDFTPALEARGLNLVVAVPAEPLWLDGDPTRLAQIIGNLLHNAGKFTDSGGSVKIRLYREGNVAALCVSDTGRGMDTTELARLFANSRQGSISLGGTRGGLGLGLALVKALVERHRGRVEARSAGLGCGATFTVRFPLAGVATGPAVPSGCS